MKFLFAVLALSVVPAAFAAAPQKKEEPPPAAAPATERPRTPGFWERAWTSTKKTADKVAGGTKRAVTAPFSRKSAATPGTPWGTLSMSMATEPAQVKIGETRAVKVTVTVVNTGRNAAQLEFPTTQRIEVLVKSDGGKVLSRASDDQRVDKEQGFLVINPEERLEYSATVSTRSMSAGSTYVIEAFFPAYEQLRASRTVSPVK